MSEAELSSGCQHDARDAAEPGLEDRRPAGAARPRSALNFGLRVAVLAGLVAVMGVTAVPADAPAAPAARATPTTGVNSQLSRVLAGPNTTCCATTMPVRGLVNPVPSSPPPPAAAG